MCIYWHLGFRPCAYLSLVRVPLYPYGISLLSTSLNAGDGTAAVRRAVLGPALRPLREELGRAGLPRLPGPAPDHPVRE